MPSKSKKQHNFMAMCASSKGRQKAKGKCPPESVAEEYVRADKRKGKRKMK